MKKINIILKFIFIISLVFFINEKPSMVNNDTYNENLSKSINESSIIKTKTKINKSIIDAQKEIYSFDGKLTAYIAECSDGCSGYLACTGKKVNTKDDIYYTDKTFGKVRIVAASSKYPCGTIIGFKEKGEYIRAIVLDKGVTGNTIDLLTDSLDKAYQIGSHNQKFNVHREGWK